MYHIEARQMDGSMQRYWDIITKTQAKKLAKDMKNSSVDIRIYSDDSNNGIKCISVIKGNLDLWVNAGIGELK